jgi:glycerophosphoryl diester phosphodiesterase
LITPIVIAHRGASGVEFENSRAAFRAAARLGADGVELDVHGARDGTLVVHHDPRIDGHPIALLGVEELAQLRLANGESPPTLADALATIGPRLRVFVEVKALDPSLDESFFRALDQGPNPSGYAVHSFDRDVIRRLGALRPRIPRGVLSDTHPAEPLRLLEETGATVLWQEAGSLDAALVAVVHATSREVFAWTVNEPSDIERALALGVDGICTNFPDRARQAIAARR